MKSQSSILAFVLFSFSLSSWAAPKREGAPFFENEEEKAAKQHKTSALSSFSNLSLSASASSNSSSSLSSVPNTFAGLLPDLKKMIFSYLGLNDQARILQASSNLNSYFKQKKLDKAIDLADVELALFSKDGLRVHAISRNQSVVTAVVIDIASGNTLNSFSGENVKFSNHDDSVITISQNNTATLWDTKTAQKISEFDLHSYPTHMFFSPDDSKFLIIGVDEEHADKTELWDVRTGRSLQIFEIEYSSLEEAEASFSEDGSKLLIACNEHETNVFNTLNGELIYKLDSTDLSSSEPPELGGIFSPGASHFLVTKNYQKTDYCVEPIWDLMSIFDSQTGTFIRKLDNGRVDRPATQDEIYQDTREYTQFFSFLADDSRIITVQQHGLITIFNLHTGEILSQFNHELKIGNGRYIPNSQPTLEVAALSADTKLLATLSDDGLLQVWNVNNGVLVTNLPFPFIRERASRIYANSFSPTGNQFLTYDNGIIKIWNINLLNP